MPLNTVALALVALQVPPGIEGVSVIAELTHTFDAPVSVPAPGEVVTDMVLVAKAEPQVLVMR